MGRDHELRVGKMGLQQLAELIAVTRVDRHDDVVEKSESELGAEQALHKREIEANPHPVLVTLAMIGAWRKQAPLVKINAQIKLASAGRKFGGECALIV